MHENNIRSVNNNFSVNTIIMSSIAFICNFCLKSFKTNSSLRRHSRQQHRGTELPPCLRRGRERSNGTPYTIVCELCELTFSSRRGFNSHRRRKHHNCDHSDKQQGSAVNKFVFNSEKGKVSLHGCIYNCSRTLVDVICCTITETGEAQKIQASMCAKV